MAYYEDSFDRTNDPDDLGADWTTQIGEFNILSNLAVGVSGTSDSSIAQYTADPMDSADYYSEADIDYVNEQGAVGVRDAFSAGDWEAYVQKMDDEWGTHVLYKYVADVETSLDSWGDSGHGTGAIGVKVQADGSTITGHFEGTERNNATDTDITADGVPAIYNYWDDSATFNNWTAEDLAATPATIKYKEGKIGVPITDEGIDLVILLQRDE